MNNLKQKGRLPVVVKKSASGLSAGEQFAGTIFFIVYLLVLPVVMGPLFRLAGHLLGRRIHADTQTAIYYYSLFAVTVVIFHGFLVRTTQRLLEDLSGACKTALIGLVGLYGLNGILFRLAGTLFSGRVNLNDSAVSSYIGDTPHMTLLRVLLLAPFVEEVLFRGLVFGSLKGRSRLLAYAASCLLFALLHVWQFAVENQDASYLLVAVQYLVHGVMLSWAYEHSGTLWASVALHAGANALSVLTILS